MLSGPLLAGGREGGEGGEGGEGLLRASGYRPRSAKVERSQLEEAGLGSLLIRSRWS